MKKVLLLFCLFYCTFSYAQKKIIKDLDGDKMADTVFLDIDSSKIVSKLSTRGFSSISSMETELLGDQNGIKETKSGFEFWSSFMRAGNACQFRYDVVSKKIQLIGMSTYEFGNAANDGSGRGSVNLLTNIYIGEWNYYNETKQQLVKLPVIKQKMTLGKIYLEQFDNKIFDDFSTKSSDLYDKQKSMQ